MAVPLVLAVLLVAGAQIPAVAWPYQPARASGPAPSPDGQRVVQDPDPYTAVLLPNYYEYYTLENPYPSNMQLKFGVTANVGVDVYVMDEGQFSVFQSTGFATAIFEVAGTNATGSAGLPSQGTYYLVVWNHGTGTTATISVSFSTVPVNIYAIKSSLPAPIGLADYGLEVTGNKAVPYTELSDGVVGDADITFLGANNASAPPPINSDGASLDLDVNLQVNTTRGDFTYWIQDVAVFRTSLQEYYVQSEVFNDSAPAGNLTASDISGHGSVFPYSPACIGCTHQNSYIYSTPYQVYSLPLGLSLLMSVSQLQSGVEVNFAYAAGGGGGGQAPATVFDAVTIKTAGTVVSSGLLVDGYKMNPEGAFYDAEFVFAGEYDGEATTFTQMGSVLRMFFQTQNGVLVQPKSAWEFGSDVAEAAYNLQTTYTSGQFMVSIGNSGLGQNYLLPGLAFAPLTLSYRVLGGPPAGVAPPVLTYIYGGERKVANLTSTPAVFYADNDSLWTVSSSFEGNTTQRWVTDQETSGVADSAIDVAIVYYHQFSVIFNFVGGGPGFTPPNVSYEALGSAQATPVGIQVWADSGSTYGYQQTLNGSSSTERWFAPAPNGTISLAAIVVAIYYHQFAFEATYSVLGGGTPIAPVLTSKYLGLTTNVTLSTSGSSTWLDAGASWSVTNPLPDSSGTERWYTSSPSVGSMTAALDVSLVYYHQFLATASYSVKGGGAPGAPWLNATTLGVPSSVSVGELATVVWLDAGSQYAMANPLPGSNASERWESPTTVSGMVGGPLEIQAIYYNQFATEASYTVVGGGTPSAPILRCTSFDDPVTETLAAAAQELWLDAGTGWSISGQLNGTAAQRWVAVSPTYGKATSSSQINATFQDQFFVAISVPPAGGSVTSASGWHDSGSSLALTATASGGWKFEGWTGAGSSSYSGPDNSTSLGVLSPINETATFYPGLALISTPGGTITYSFGSQTGTVQGSTTIYVPVGTAVKLSSSPSSFFNSLTSWSGAASGSSTTTGVLVTAPTAVTANFGYNIVDIGAVVGVAAVAAAGVSYLVLKGRRRGTSSMATQVAPAAPTSPAPSNP